MPNANFVIFHVKSPERSAIFYADLLGLRPIQQSPTFTLFALPSGLMFGLWSRDTVNPAGSTSGDGSELAFTVEGADAVDDTHAKWARRDLTVLMPPTTMDFGRSFVALDPDGHRLRVFAPMPA